MLLNLFDGTRSNATFVTGSPVRCIEKEFQIPKPLVYFTIAEKPPTGQNEIVKSFLKIIYIS